MKPRQSTSLKPVHMHFILPRALHEELRIAGILKRTPASELIRQAIHDYLWRMRGDLKRGAKP